MRDYGLQFLNTLIHVDNTAAISITKNPVQHSKTKHIEIRYHIIRDCYEKKLIDLIKIHTDFQKADLFTKAFDKSRFDFLLSENGIKTMKYVGIEAASGSSDKSSAWSHRKVNFLGFSYFIFLKNTKSKKIFIFRGEYSEN